MFRRFATHLLLMFFFPIALHSEMIQIDKGVIVNGLWCFPTLNDATKYFYLPQNPHIALDKNKQPQFSFIRYVKNLASSKAEGKSITEAQGGAILHFLVTYDTPQEKIDAAQQELQQVSQKFDAEIVGPVIFKEGRFTLISSILTAGSKIPERQIITTGQAPLLEGGRIALSFEMTAERSKLLLESFKMATPDISMLFEMTFSGLSDAYNATMKVKWDDVYKSESINKTSSFLFLSSDIQKTYAELQRTQSIQLTTAGNDENMEAIVNSAYQKLTDLLFTPFDPEALTGKEQEQTQGKMSTQIDLLGLLTTHNPLNLNSNKAYKRKEIKNSGTSELTFNSRLNVDRYHMMVFNIGELYKKFGNDERFFRDINMDDAAFQQREIRIGIDGEVLPEFDKMIDNVTVTLRKIHENGQETIQEINLTKNKVNENNVLELIYGSQGDKDREKWMNYDFKTAFAFKGGGMYETPWTTQNFAMINLHPPYQRRVIQLDGDIQKLKTQNVRAVNVQIEFLFLGEEKKVQQTVRVNEGLNGKQLEITLPKNVFDYHYKMNWIMEDGSQKTFTGTGSSGVMYIDNLPAS